MIAARSTTPCAPRPRALAGDQPARAGHRSRSRPPPPLGSRCCCSSPSGHGGVITSTGGVTKRVISYDEPVDPARAWAASYLNERSRHGGRRAPDRPKLADRSWGPRTRLPGHGRAGFYRARAGLRGQPVHGGRRAVAFRAPLSGAVADRRADGGPRAPARAAGRAARIAHRAERLPAHRPRESHAGAADVSIVAANTARPAQPRAVPASAPAE